MLVDLATLKLHCRVDASDEDTLITAYGEAADERVASYLNRKIYANQNDMDDAVDSGVAGDDPMVVNDSVKAAIMLLDGHLYANREAVVEAKIEMQELPMGVMFLLTPYRVGMGL